MEGELLEQTKIKLYVMNSIRLLRKTMAFAMLASVCWADAKEMKSGELQSGTANSPVSVYGSGDARFEAGNGVFLLNGKPFVVKAAELHYPRIPKEYWEQRIQMCKALGMNTVCLYTFWNAHEPEQDRFDFTGQNDLRKFIELCNKNGMKVILRPGPYVCAEWEDRKSVV